MENINKEFRFFKNNEENEKNKIEIIKSEPKEIIDEKGNLTTTPSQTYYIGKKENYLFRSEYKRLSKDYYGIMHLHGDHYIVIDVCPTEINEKANNLQDKTNFKFKFGIIRFQRNVYENNSIIPQQERIIAPIIYDQIYIYDNFYPIVEVNGHYTYFCLDINNRENYGKQLVPLVLESASPFNIKYQDFAECTINGKTRFIPRNLNATESITPDDLLTEEEVLYLLNSYDKFEKYEKLTNQKIPHLVKSLHK